MHPAVITKVERARGCGFCSKHGLYLVCDGAGSDCGKLPIVLSVCPVCHSGIHPSRGWTWIDSDRLSETEHCVTTDKCRSCPLSAPMGRVGLLWVGKQFYDTPEKFNAEAALMGISRRISAIPRDFKVGETWIWLAHPEVVKNPEPQPPPAVYDKLLNGQDQDEIDEAAEELAKWEPMLPAVFRIFRPTRIEYIVDGTESDQQIESLLKRGLTPVRVIREQAEPGLFSEDASAIAD